METDEQRTPKDEVDLVALAAQLSATWVEAWRPVLQSVLDGVAAMARDLQAQGYFDSEFNLTPKAFEK